MTTQLDIASAEFEALSDVDLIGEARSLRERVEHDSWREADIYLALLGRDWTTRSLAEACGCSQSRIAQWSRCAKNNPPDQPRPPFPHAYAVMMGRVAATQGEGEDGESVSFSTSPFERWLEKLAAKIQTLDEPDAEQAFLTVTRALVARIGWENLVPTFERERDDAPDLQATFEELRT